MATEGMSISGLANAAGVHVETIRYYQRRGLLARPPKPLRGWRRYDPKALSTLRFVRRAQSLGFSLDDVELLLRLRASDSPQTCARVGRKAREKLAELDEKMRDLVAIRALLASVVEACPGEGPGSACPVLDALEDDDGDEEPTEGEA